MRYILLIGLLFCNIAIADTLVCSGYSVNEGQFIRPVFLPNQSDYFEFKTDNGKKIYFRFENCYVKTDR